MSLELTGVHGLLKRHKLFTHKCYSKNNFLQPQKNIDIDIGKLYNSKNLFYYCIFVKIN